MVHTRSRPAPTPTQPAALRRPWLWPMLTLLLLSTSVSADDGWIATFSIVARDPGTGDLGVAVQSKYFGVGSVVPHARANVGALATQARGNILYGPQGLGLLESGVEPEEAIERLLADDPLRAQRQVGMVAADGSAATYTGDETLPWSGGKTGDGYAAQGNLLAGPEVVDAMAAAFETTDGALPTRLVTALAAGQAAGGDARGRQSAALLVVHAGSGYMGANDRLVDLHVEDHPTPIKELNRLLGIRLSQVAVHEARMALAAAARWKDQPEKAADALAEAKRLATEAVERYEDGDAGWLVLADAEAGAGDMQAASAAARRALLINPLLKRYSVMPETGLGIDPGQLETLLEDDDFRKVWDALPGEDDVHIDATAVTEPAE